ncbi:MAG: C39 family peptidase [Candidatus Eisenbacteria bacterium]
MRSLATVVVLLLCVSIQTFAAPVTAEDAVGAAALRVADVSLYSRANPDAPGAMAPWSVGDAVPGRPVLVHAYPTLAPSYYYVPVLNERGEQTSFVTLGADDGRVQAYGEVRDGTAYPAVSREQASELASATLGLSVSPDELIAVSMPNRTLYWHLPSAADHRELFINLGDPADVHTHLDESLTPPDVVAEAPPTAQEVAIPPAPSAVRYPTSYNLSVPHYYQGTWYNCGPASVEMVFDYWGPHVNQTDIRYVANCTSGAGGSHALDNRRAGHFSSSSTAILDGTLHGYDERWLGYSACECQWSYPNTSDPDYSTRYTDLYELVYAGYPIEVLTHYDATHGSGHFRVVKGYNNSTNVFIVHDPWYSAPYQGPNVNFDQAFFVDDLWTRYYRWGTLLAPWLVEVTAPASVIPGTQFTLSVEVLYRGPHPFDGQYLTGTGQAAPLLPTGFELAPGETSTKSLTGLGTSGTTGTASWQVLAGCDPGMESLGVRAVGQIGGSSYSYASYVDVIGGEGSTGMEVLAASRVVFVDVGGGGDFLTIKDGIDDARCDGELVVVADGWYTGTSNKNLDFGGKNITVLGGGPATTFIDCQNSGRGFYFHSGEDTTAKVSGFTIAAGQPSGTFPYGGGIQIENASPKLEDLVITDCSAYCGGGISSIDASPVIKSVALIFNHASDYGGGIFCTRDSLGGRYEDVDIVDNSAGYGGGGIYDTYNTHSLYDVYLHGNSAQWGGGMYIGRSAPTITRAHFQYNTATRGAAMFIPYESEAEITRSTVVHNTTTDGGYAAVQSNDSQPTITQTIIGYNYGGGGGMACAGPKLPTTYHSLSYGNAGGDSLCGNHHDNLFRDPYFCDEPADDFTLHDDSPCLPTYNPWAVHMGREGLGGCGYAGIDGGELPVSKLSLLAPSPNPFGVESVIGFEAPANDVALTVAVYDLSGRLVSLLHDGPVPEARGTLVWDGRDDSGRRVASGVYFVRGTLGEETIGKKLVVLR